MTDIFDTVYGSGFDNDDENKPLSVLEAKRIHRGKITVLGTIVSVSEMYILEVKDSIKPNIKEMKDAKSIQLEDSDKLGEIERLDVILYEDMLSDVRIGEVVRIRGDIEIEDKKSNGKSKKKVNVLHATSIKYVNRKEVIVTDVDIKTFYKFVGCKHNLIERLTDMFAPNIVGHDDVKVALLRSIVGGIDSGKKGGGRIDTLLVGDPGTAKSTLAKEATEIKPNSRFVSAPHASTKTITAIVEKESESLVLRLGAIPLSRGAVCGINEITTFTLEDQSRLLDILEEGQFPVDKHGRHHDVQSPTTIIATANPIQTTWRNSQIISNDEIELRKNLLDRFTQIQSFRDQMVPTQVEQFAKHMNKVRQRRAHNYNFLRKYLIYASSIKDVTIKKDAEYMLNKFWINAKNKGLLSIRMYYGLYKIAEAQAKLQLKEVIDEEIAKQTIESVQLMMVQYGPTVGSITGPRETTYNAFLDILQKTDTDITLEELCRRAYDENSQIAEYLGKVWSLENNHKLRNIVDMLLNHNKIRRTHIRPLTFKWTTNVDDPTDSTDLNDMNINQNH